MNIKSKTYQVKPAPPAARQPGEEVATTQWGAPAFRVLNFELYTKPTGWNRVLAYAGTTIFVGIMGYWTFVEQ